MSWKLLLVGDYHAEPATLDDCQKLADLIVEVAIRHGATVLFTGDQYHTHAIIHAEVQRFWHDLYKRIARSESAHPASISLVGNHDRPGSAGSKATAMLAHLDQTVVISEPTEMDGVLFMPHFHDAESFVAAARKHSGAHTLICHQTFYGARYENGALAEDGVNLNLIPQKTVISGHIHTPQLIDKVWYVGAPRWRTLSDANTNRAIWYVEIDDEGNITKRVPYDTGKVCRQIYALVDTEEDPVTCALDPQHEWRIDVHGTLARIEERAAFFKAQGAKVRTFKTELAAPKVRESEGIDVAFGNWVDNYRPQHGTDQAVLRKMLKERVNV